MTASTSYLELLSPCRNADIGIEAINHGADAVYAGGPLFSARANAGNSMSEIARLSEYAHRFRARVFMALNTIMSDRELEEAVKIARQAWDAGVDALIVQDMGLLMCDLPPIQLHASTQCDIRTPEKAVFLEKVGFSQIVPARELDLGQIKEMHDSLTRARIEFFIHGALCVSYSGQCYASQVLKGRSANRGECAQICRLPFDVYDEEGNLLRRNSHVLSLRDNNQTNNLEALIEAGVRSFKIEGRYKDASYVKNTVAHYRRLLDACLLKHPEFSKGSQGTAHFNFEPDIRNAFNRGSTDYFVNGRNKSLVNFDSPKNTGSVIGTVKALRDRVVVVESKAEFNNGDGLTFVSDTSQLEGFLVNRAERNPEGHNQWLLHTREKTSSITGLSVGVSLMRNKDSAWLKKMNAQTSLRKIPIRIEAVVKGNSITLTATDEENNRAEVSAEGSFDKAKNAEQAQEQLRKSLGKLGNTDYEAQEAVSVQDEVRFFPTSFINELRRNLVSSLDDKRRTSFQRLPNDAADKDAAFCGTELDYHGNVMNGKARKFYAEHHAAVVQPALEAGGNIPEEVEVMRCKYCIRYALDMCPKEAKKQGVKLKPSPLRLVTGGKELEARFICKPCEMSIVYKPKGG